MPMLHRHPDDEDVAMIVGEYTLEIMAPVLVPYIHAPWRCSDRLSGLGLRRIAGGHLPHPNEDRRSLPVPEPRYTYAGGA